jgi:hypothetical protein
VDGTDVVLPVAALPALRPPPLCARTGRPAGATSTLTIMRRPSWAWASLVLGVLGIALIYAVSKRVTVPLPIAPETRRRRVLLLLATVGAFVLFLASVFTVDVLAAAVRLTGMAVSVVLLVVAWRAYVRAWVAGRWVDDAHVRLSRVHPAVAEALAAQVAAMARAGWHPDPGGEHRLRWYDGQAWTAHVHD